MSHTAIHVAGLSKRYQLGATASMDRTFREMIHHTLGRVLRRSQDAGKQGDFWALRDVSFDVREGEAVGIIGANGAGKSTLLKLLSAITDPTEGLIRLRGRVGSLLEVGTGFHPELTGRENIYLNGAILGMRRAHIKSKFDEIVAFAGVERFIDTPVKRYSSGMYVRLAFAVAAHLEPEILIVDEVLAVGDASFQQKCLGKMSDVAGAGRTVLFVSHHMAAVRSLCDRCILLDHGRVTMDDAPEAVIARYLATAQTNDTGELAWPIDQAPGADELRLTSLRLLDNDDEPRASFANDKPIAIEIGYVARQPIRGVRFIVQLLTGEGAVAFTSTDHLERPDTLAPGTYVTRCTVPAKLLNTGRYLVAVAAGIPGVKVLVPRREYLGFTTVAAVDHGSHFPEQWPGAVAPRLAWHTSTVSDTTRVAA